MCCRIEQTSSRRSTWLAGLVVHVGARSRSSCLYVGTGGDSRDPTPPALLTHTITGHLMPCHWSWTRLQLTPTGTVRATAAHYHCRCPHPNTPCILYTLISISMDYRSIGSITEPNGSHYLNMHAAAGCSAVRTVCRQATKLNSS